MFKKKRGQESGVGAAVLVVVIAILIIVYIMFIPAGEREKLLEGKSSSSIDGDYDNDVERLNLLSEMPGKLTYLKQDEVDHDLPSVNLFTKTEGQVLKEKNSLYVKKAVFSDETDNMTFVINEIENAKNLLLNFEVESASGRMMISLNGEQIFNSELKLGQNNPIKLPKDLLKNENILEFQASSVGAAFWKTNEYTIDMVQVTGDITDVSARSAKMNFIVDEFEKKNVNKVKIRYYPDCTVSDVGKLSVTLNDCKVFSGVPDCEQLSIHEVLPYCLSEGENVLELETEKGHYLLDRIQIQSDLKETRDFIYDFQLNSSQYNRVKQGRAFVNLSMRFDDAQEDKEARIIINGHETVLSTDRLKYKDKINIFVNRGTNIVKILPKNDFYVAEFNVDYFD